MDSDNELMAMTDKQCEKLFDSVIEMNKNMAGITQDTHWLKENAKNQIEWCRRNEDRLVELEKWMGRSKGHFKVIGRAFAILAAAIIAISTILYQIFRGG